MLMLRSFALECLLKALILRKGKEFYCEGDQRSYGKGHHLLKLAKDASIVLTEEQSDMLDRLEMYVYLGRYPLLKKHAKDRVFSRLDRAPKCPWSFVKDEKLFSNVLGKIETALFSPIDHKHLPDL